MKKLNMILLLTIKGVKDINHKSLFEITSE